MPCAPEFSYLDSASAELGPTGGRSGIPSDLTGALPRLALRHEGLLHSDSRAARELRPNSRKNPQHREENADDRAGHRGPPSAAAARSGGQQSAPVEHVTGAQSLIRPSREVGADTVFGIPGGAILPAYDPLMDSTRVRHVLVRHEQGAGHAATGYAQATGKGRRLHGDQRSRRHSNLVTPIADARHGPVPLVAITGQVASKAIGTDAFQEADIVGITMPITKHNFLVTKAEDIPRIIAQAFHIASTGRPGPVLVDIAKDALQAKTTFSWPPVMDLPGYRPVTKPHASRSARPRSSSPRPGGPSSTSAAASSRRRPRPS
ncbi:hypothetical protein LT493_25130 [Streptomyces tricolor]|nr:hypothetical protein [Streptomyces tricolor]